MFDRDAFEERAAIAEFDGGLSRFEAETLAAKSQGLTRWQALEAIKNEDGKRNPASGGHHGPAHVRHGADNMPGVQRATAQQIRPVPVGHVQVGRDRVALLAL